MGWNPDIYNKFKLERYAPFYDLLQLVNVKPGLKGIDMGCGTGELTRQLSDHLPGSWILGIDSSREMLKGSDAFQNDQVMFKCTTIDEQISDGEKWDIIFSNAAIQWVDDHDLLLPQIISRINKGGQLVIQIPANHDHFTHVTLQNMALSDPYKTALNSWSRISPVLNIENYARIYFDNGGTEITVYEKVYPHVLKNADAMFDWTAGTAMIPYLERLSADLKESFKEIYKSRLRNKFKESPVFYPFKRILMAATF